MRSAILLTCLLPLSCAAPDPAPVEPGPPSADLRPTIVVTGASSGIGRVTAEHLARNGFHVFAGARKQTDLDALSALDHVDGLRLDVTEPDEIAAAVETVRSSRRRLAGLINNAGVVVFGPLVEMPVDELEFQMDVNVTGPFRVTQAFAPLLIEHGGRVSTTGSISGIVTWGMGGAYCMSKHAVEAYTDTLAQELEPFGVQVSVVEPGNWRSKIMESLAERMAARGYTSEGSLYKEQMDSFLASPKDRSQHRDPLPVAEAFLHAMTSDEPKRRYLVTPNSGEARATLRAGFARLAELNRDQPFELTRDELVRMLDEALAGAERSR